MTSQSHNTTWWNTLLHEGLMLDESRLQHVLETQPRTLDWKDAEELRVKLNHMRHDQDRTHELIRFVLEDICNFEKTHENEDRNWMCRLWNTTQLIQPDKVCNTQNIPVLPIFISPDPTQALTRERGRRDYARVIHWLRCTRKNLALLTNGKEWRIICAGEAEEAFVQWNVTQWLRDGQPTPELNGFIALMNPQLWTPDSTQSTPLLKAIQQARKGQNELSSLLGERVRNAVELLIQAHGDALAKAAPRLTGQPVYLAAVRMVMRLVVACFAESRQGLLPLGNTVFNQSYALASLLHNLKIQKAQGAGLEHSFQAWPRLLALMSLIYQGSQHPELIVTHYGGELFKPAEPDSKEPIQQALHIFETQCFKEHIMPDMTVCTILQLLAETQTKIRHGHTTVTQTTPIDFASLGNEYIGILFESLLNFELRQAPKDSPVLFLNLGDCPAFKLADLESMTDTELKALFKNLRRTNSHENAVPQPRTQQETQENNAGKHDDRTRAWTQRAEQIMRGTKQKNEEQQKTTATLIFKCVKPNDWYLVRWNGTRKGSGTFYTKPQLASPTVIRTLQPLCYTQQQDGQSIPKTPQEIISLKICDPACGSGSFLLAALRFLTNALFQALQAHHRLDSTQGKSITQLIWPEQSHGQTQHEDTLQLAPQDDAFETTLKNRLRRIVVKHCIYGVDLDPLGVQLCRLSLWIETMDPCLPMTFLNDRIKCGNSLVGAWKDQVDSYPVSAWKREGADKDHTNGMHAPKARFHQIIKSTYLTAREQSRQQEQTTLWNRHDRTPEQTPTPQSQKEKHDLWCALWFWPGKDLKWAPMPQQVNRQTLPDETRKIVSDIAQQHQFFHWELEFPEVFEGNRNGFDAILGNPPWDIAKPKSQEFFAAVDPLFRTYGKQKAIAMQKELFQNPQLEQKWLDYAATFKDMSNWVKEVGNYPQKQNPNHPFNCQGTGDLNLYKLFLEMAYTLTRPGGWFGLVVPSGIYSDAGTQDLRQKFLQTCNWAWLMGFENRLHIFDIHASYKFNPVILQKQGTTKNIHAAFMQRDISAWENAEKIAFDYPLETIRKLSPDTWTLLEFKDRKQLNSIASLYSHAQTIAAQNGDAWNITMNNDLHMTADSHLFPPRTIWEQTWNYRPDEYSRWIKAPWKPISQLYELPDIIPALRNQTIPQQPPYQTLKLKRSQFPKGIILSRDAQLWIRQDEIPQTTFLKADGSPMLNEQGKPLTGPAIAYPLYEGSMIGIHDFNAQGWFSHLNQKPDWNTLPQETKSITPQYLIPYPIFMAEATQTKLAFRTIGNATNQRTMYAALLPQAVCGNSLGIITTATSKNRQDDGDKATLAAIIGSFAFDAVVRCRLTGLNLSQFILKDCPIIPPDKAKPLRNIAQRLGYCDKLFAPQLLELGDQGPLPITPHERKRLMAIIDAIVAKLLGVTEENLRTILTQCDWTTDRLKDRNQAKELEPKGFWRVQKQSPPEQRQTVLTLVAFRELQKIQEKYHDEEQAIREFLNLNDGQGWLFPDYITLADYDLGQDDRARTPQPLATALGPRFYPWQLEQTPEDRVREWELHAYNMSLPHETTENTATTTYRHQLKSPDKPQQQLLFDL